MTKDQKLFVGVGVVVLLLVIGFWVYFLSSQDDKVEKGKVYSLAFTYLAKLQMPDGKVVPGRMFDFVDRNVVKSKPAPLSDGRSTIVVEDLGMRTGTVVLLEKKIPSRTIEGIEYPAQEWSEWHFNFNQKSRQDFVPTIIVKK